MMSFIFQDSDCPLAMIDMRGNLLAAGVFLVLGVILLSLVRPVTKSSKPRRSLIVTAFFSGPALALAYYVADILWIAPHLYVVPEDYSKALLQVLVIGYVGGTIGAVAIGIGECMSCYFQRKCSGATKSNEEEESP
jgi:apolipoprotein N-acyltransferase